ncbi:MAG: glutamate--tRNA ligase, partial [Ruminococcaceae bacterium]|nr:glutamate--tRNA ligase [Oscillospiraceae bacterium]
FEGIHTALFKLIEEKGVKNGYMLWPLRVALSGVPVSPGGGIELAAILGKEETIKRVKKGLAQL